MDYIKFRALRLTTIPQTDFESMAAETHSTGRLPEYVSGQLEMCKRIGFTPEKIALEERSVAQLAYANYLQINASRNDWLKPHVMMIACAYVGKLKSSGRYGVDFSTQGWSRIAKELYDKEFILANIDTTDPVGNPERLSADSRKLSGRWVHL